MTNGRGTLLLIVGPSGVGKDTLIAGARAALRDDKRFAFPRRSITRPSDAGGEDHVAVTPEQFDRAVSENGFSLYWCAHGLQYGLPNEVSDLLADGVNVVANISRQVIDLARLLYPPVRVISVTASHRELAARLQQRGRETPEEIEARLRRPADGAPTGRDVVYFRNDAPIDQSVNRFIALLR
ncbi:MAG: phosphonate metabolism protein/1,5-bisphosphokinase (PRPP-forming) PhnN [Minwuiales bacterium]|nr:phosphonate metabolism protein/1,5-bisphosphokinase (PRPP-forming) PhnN [Minwuiales bacterium]